MSNRVRRKPVTEQAGDDKPQKALSGWLLGYVVCIEIVTAALVVFGILYFFELLPNLDFTGPLAFAIIWSIAAGLAFALLIMLGVLQRTGTLANAKDRFLLVGHCIVVFLSTVFGTVLLWGYYVEYGPGLPVYSMSAEAYDAFHRVATVLFIFTFPLAWTGTKVAANYY